jgi:hypothetical protein
MGNREQAHRQKGGTQRKDCKNRGQSSTATARGSTKPRAVEVTDRHRLLTHQTRAKATMEYAMSRKDPAKTEALPWNLV